MWTPEDRTVVPSGYPQMGKGPTGKGLYLT